MSAKDRHRVKLIEYLANPKNDFMSREDLAVNILKVKPRTLYAHFTGVDLDEIEAEAHELRRKRFASEIAMVDKALLKNAQENGNAAECKLVYQRLEGWSEKQIKEHTGKDGGPIEHATKLEVAKELLDEVAGSTRQLPESPGKSEG